MHIDPGDLALFVDVARAGGFRDAARLNGKSPSWLSQSIRQLEERLGVRLFNRTTRSVVLTEAGRHLFERVAPAFAEIDAAVDVVNGYRTALGGTLKLNVPTVAARLILPALLPRFLAAYPGIEVEVVVDENVIDIIASGCDAGIRYEERLEADMIATPIGARHQRFAAAASPAYLALKGHPAHPRDLLSHACIRARFPAGSLVPWTFACGDEHLTIEPSGPLIVRTGGATDLAVAAAVAGTGVIQLFEDWLQPYFDSGDLLPVLEPWWSRFTGPFLYYPGRRLIPAPLRAFIDFIKSAS